MNVGFFTILKRDPIHYILADVLIRSVRQTMPGVRVTQFTDEQSPGVYGVDAVLRKPKTRMAVLRMAHQASVEGDWLFVDTDVVIQRDVRPVFEEAFDIAVSDRNWSHLPAATDTFSAAMPHNIGVVFSRSPAFWQVVHDRLLVLPEELQSWMGDQVAACEVIRSGRFAVKLLAGMEYNYPPSNGDEAWRGRASILHYKGQRKPLLLQQMAVSP